MFTNIFPRPAIPSDLTKTRRREARSSVRGQLGPSSDPAPTLEQALRAADELKRIVDMASGGRYGLAVVRAPLYSGDTPEQPQWAFYRGELNKSSQVHEPISETLQRELTLRKESPLGWVDYQ